MKRLLPFFLLFLIPFGASYDLYEDWILLPEGDGFIVDGDDSVATFLPWNQTIAWDGPLRLAALEGAHVVQIVNRTDGAVPVPDVWWNVAWTQLILEVSQSNIKLGDSATFSIRASFDGLDLPVNLPMQVFTEAGVLQATLTDSWSDTIQISDNADQEIEFLMETPNGVLTQPEAVFPLALGEETPANSMGIFSIALFLLVVIRRSS